MSQLHRIITVTFVVLSMALLGASALAQQSELTRDRGGAGIGSGGSVAVGAGAVNSSHGGATLSTPSSSIAYVPGIAAATSFNFPTLSAPAPAINYHPFVNNG